MSRLRSGLAALLGGLVLAAAPAQALERLVLRLPFLQTSITFHLGDGQSVDELIRSSPDLADLASASNGRAVALLRTLLLTPLPLQTTAFLRGATGQPLLEQALAAAAYFVDLQGVELDTSGRLLTDALARAERNGQPTILGFQVYAGGIGYFSANGEFDTCIALRTAVAKNKKFYVQAGAGIVADSKPKNEYEETVNKAKALINALR